MILKRLKKIIKKTPFVIPLLRLPYAMVVSTLSEINSKKYWQKRYERGQTSGEGSYGKFSQFKASVINAYVIEKNVSTIIEFGVGDGAQLKLMNYPKYIGLDISKVAIKKCSNTFKSDSTKSFFLYDNQCFLDNSGIFKSDLSLSLDVIYHLIEDCVYEDYMNHLFNSSQKYVIIYSSNDTNIHSLGRHVKHRNFSHWVDKNYPNWSLIKKIDNKYPFSEKDQTGSFANFFFYEKK